MSFWHLHRYVLALNGKTILETRRFSKLEERAGDLRFALKKGFGEDGVMEVIDGSPGNPGTTLNFYAPKENFPKPRKDQKIIID